MKGANMKTFIVSTICFLLLFASSPAAWADNGNGDEGRRFAFLPGAGGHFTNTEGEGETFGVAIAALLETKNLPRYWPNIIGLNFAMNGDQNPDDPLLVMTPPENTLSLEAWWLPLKGGPFEIGPGLGGTWANFGVTATDFGGIYGVSIKMKTPEAAPDLMITIADHFSLDEWDGIGLQARVQVVRDFELAF
jgi:hypothetical protein